MDKKRPNQLVQIGIVVIAITAIAESNKGKINTGGNLGGNQNLGRLIESERLPGLFKGENFNLFNNRFIFLDSGDWKRDICTGIIEPQILEKHSEKYCLTCDQVKQPCEAAPDVLSKFEQNNRGDTA